MAYASKSEVAGGKKYLEMFEGKKETTRWQNTHDIIFCVL